MDKEIITKTAKNTLENIKPQQLKQLSDLCLVGGFASIAASILFWGVRRATANEGHAERLGIFVGLWAPTFFILSSRFERYADRLESAREEGSE